MTTGSSGGGQEVEGGGGGGGGGGRFHPGSLHACQIRSAMLSTPPHLKVHDPSHKLCRIEERSAYLFLL